MSDVKEVRPLSAYENALVNAPNRYAVITIYERHQVTNDKGKLVWRQSVIGRKVTDEKQRVVYFDDTSRPFQ